MGFEGVGVYTLEASMYAASDGNGRLQRPDLCRDTLSAEQTTRTRRGRPYMHPRASSGIVPTP